MATRIAVDIGGTFTDLVYFDAATGKTVQGKVPTVPAAPEDGVAAAIAAHVPQEVLTSAEFFLHGTTVGLNALLERRGSVVGLIATQGFRDVLEIRRGDRAEMYNLFWQQTKPLVPRRLRLEVPGRTFADGTTEGAPTPEAVAAAVQTFQAHDVTSIAVSLMHAYANPEHELLVEKHLRDAGFTGGITLSHRVCGEIREYERTSTAVIDAFVRGRMANYLNRLEAQLRASGFVGKCLITRSGGGSMNFSEAEERPFETIMSGPVGGAIGASEFARMIGDAGMITADVGGTSFDTALILNHEPQVLFEGEIDNMPILSPWVDVRSIGAGGGSLAYEDGGGFMRVGPQSAGAEPGPACYGKGGTNPAVTDAAAYLGMLGPGELASGISLDGQAAEDALSPVARAIDQTVEDTAAGVMRIAASSMANTIREISIEQGLDAREMSLLPFGGAGGMMATLLAEEMAMKRIVVPPFAGIFSAWGLLGADMVQSASRTLVRPLTDTALTEVAEVFADLIASIKSRGETAPDAEASLKLDVRYVGQEHTLSVPVTLDGLAIAETAATITTRFSELYTKSFGATLNDGLEVTAIRAQLKAALPKRGHASPTETSLGMTEGTINAYSFRDRKRVPFAICPRDDIAAGVSGPVIITETVATTYVDAGWHAALGSFGEINITRRDDHAV